MMNRTQMILGAVLAVQVLILAALNLSTLTGAASIREVHALLPVLDSITPAKIAIADGDDRSVVLERQAEGWVLPEAGNYPVLPDKVGDLIDDLKGIDVRRPIVTSSRYHSALKVTEDDFERRVQIWANASDDPDIDLLVGTSPNYRITHVRTGDADDVYEAMGFSSAELRSDAGSWIEKKFIDVPFDEITAVEIENASGTFGLEKKDGTWTIVSPPKASGKELDQSKVDSFVRSLASMWLVDPVGRIDEEAQGLAEPAARIALVRTPPPPADDGPPAGDADGSADAVTGGDGGEVGGESGTTTPVGEEAPGTPGETSTASGDTASGGVAAASATPAPPPTEVVEYRIGAPQDEESGQRYVARKGFDFAVTVSKYDAEKALDKKLDDLLKKEASGA